MGALTKAEFFARLRREGKEQFGIQVYDEEYDREMQRRASQRGAKVKFAHMAALKKAMQRFPPDPAAEKRQEQIQEKLREREVLLKERAKLQEHARARKRIMDDEDARAKRRHEMVVRQLRDKTGKDVEELPEPIAWAMNHMHEVGDTSDMKTWKILPKDAPSAAAWNMLMYACDSRKDFIQLVFKQLMDRQAKEEARKAREDELRLKAKQEGSGSSRTHRMDDPNFVDEGLDDVREMLSRYRKQDGDT